MIKAHMRVEVRNYPGGRHEFSINGRQGWVVSTWYLGLYAEVRLDGTKLLSSIPTRYLRPIEGTTADHKFKPSYTGMVCDEMFVDSNGFGDVCGRPASEHYGKATCPECTQSVLVHEGRFVEHIVKIFTFGKYGRLLPCAGTGRTV